MEACLDKYVRGIVSSQLTQVSQEAQKGIQRVQQEAQQTVSNLRAYLFYTVPVKVHDATMELVDGIAERLRKYSEIMTGHDKNSSKQYASILKPHFDWIENVRATNPKKYEELVAFAEALRKNKINDQGDVAVEFFTRFVKT